MSNVFKMGYVSSLTWPTPAPASAATVMAVVIEVLMSVLLELLLDAEELAALVVLK